MFCASKENRSLVPRKKIFWSMFSIPEIWLEQRSWNVWRRKRKCTAINIFLRHFKKWQHFEHYLQYRKKSLEHKCLSKARVSSVSNLDESCFLNKNSPMRATIDFLKARVGRSLNESYVSVLYFYTKISKWNRWKLFNKKI